MTGRVLIVLALVLVLGSSAQASTWPPSRGDSPHNWPESNGGEAHAWPKPLRGNFHMRNRHHVIWTWSEFRAPVHVDLR